MPAELALQDAMPENVCYGCGPLNTQGLHIKSYYQDGRCTGAFTPKPHHSTFVSHFVNGGILASIVDCHSIWAAMAHAYAREQRVPGSQPPIRYVTANLNLDYLKAVPMSKTLQLCAEVTVQEEKKSFITCTVSIDDYVYVRAKVLAIRVKEAWSTQAGG